MAKRQRFTAEFKEQAVRLVVDTSRPIVDVARELGVNAGTLANWVNKYREASPVGNEPLSVSERSRLVELEKENRELRMKAEFLGKGAPRTREVALGSRGC